MNIFEDEPEHIDENESDWFPPGPLNTQAIGLSQFALNQLRRLLHESNSSEATDYSEDNSIHEYHPENESEPANSDEHIGDDPDGQEYVGFVSMMAISRARRLGFDFHHDTTLKGGSLLALYVRLHWLVMKGPFTRVEIELYANHDLRLMPSLEDIALVVAGMQFGGNRVIKLWLDNRPVWSIFDGYPNTGYWLQHHYIITTFKNQGLITGTSLRNRLHALETYPPNEYEEESYALVMAYVEAPTWQTQIAQLHNNSFLLNMREAVSVTKQLALAERKRQKHSPPDGHAPKLNFDPRMLAPLFADSCGAAYLPGILIPERSNFVAREPVCNEYVQLHPYSTGFLNGKQFFGLALFCGVTIEAALAAHPHSSPRPRRRGTTFDEDGGFFGPPRPKLMALKPWQKIQMCFTLNQESSRMRACVVDRFIVFANNQALMIINMFEPDLARQSLLLEGLTMAHIFRCSLRIKVTAEVAEGLDAAYFRLDRDGPIWTLLLPFYLNGGTPNKIEMSIIAGQAPQVGKSRSDWDRPLHRLHNILFATLITKFPLDILHREKFWIWLENKEKKRRKLE